MKVHERRQRKGQSSLISHAGGAEARHHGETALMSDLWDDIDDDDVSPICPECGVSALPPEAIGEPSMCENPNCSAFGEPI